MIWLWILAIFLYLGYRYFIPLLIYILIYVSDRVDNPRYRRLVDILVHSLRARDTNETGYILQEILHILGTSRYTPVKYTGENTLCPISRSTIKKGDMVIILSCGHMALPEEMNKWIETNTTCPVCRAQC